MRVKDFGNVRMPIGKTWCSIAMLFASILFTFITFILFSAMIGCDKKEEPIKIGFVGGLTGRLSGLAVSGRNGVILAVEQTNHGGGINGRPVELIIKNDHEDPVDAVRVDQELVDEGVVAIIGHMTSAMTIAAVPLINEKRIPMISPTASTNQLSGIDDYFIRLMPPKRATTEILARYAFKKMGVREIAGVYSLTNSVYAKGFMSGFKQEFERLGGKIIDVSSFTSTKETDFSKLASSLIKHDSDAILVVAGALDAAMICQQLRMRRPKIPILSSGWSMTEDFIKRGGPSVERVVFSQLFDGRSRDGKFLEFKRQFEKRFGEKADFPAILSYEAARVVFKALTQNSDPAQLKATILKQGMFEGVQGDIKVDKYGDPHRKRIIITVKGGQFESAYIP